MENLEIANKRQYLLDLIWAHSKTPEEVEEAFHDYTNSLRMAKFKELDALREQNAALRAAVLEMQRMLPVLETLEPTYPVFIMEGLNRYKHALETALAKIESK